jgi:glutaredoxin 2
LNDDVHYKKKGTALLKHLWRHIQVDPENRVHFPGGRVSRSNILDLIKYFVSSKRFTTKRPADVVPFARLLKDTNAPITAIGKDLEEILASVDQEEVGPTDFPQLSKLKKKKRRRNRKTRKKTRGKPSKNKRRRRGY